MTNYLARCVFALIMVLVAASPLPNLDAQRVKAASSGAHLWWIFPAGFDRTHGPFELIHHAFTDDEKQFQVASIFNEEPIAVAADGDRVWVVFESLNHKMEVVSGATQFNPASELWFITKGGALQLCPSIAGDSLESFAAFNGEAWAIVAGEQVARVLHGDKWNSVQLPDAINECQARMLVVAGGALNALGQAADKSIKRFKRESQAWIESPIKAREFLYAVDHSARFACVTGNRNGEEVLNWIEAGELTPIVEIAKQSNATRRVLGVADGFACIEFAGRSTQNTAVRKTLISVLASGAAQFNEPVVLRVQSSMASRWYHLPILGVLSLGAIIAAFLVRALNSPLNPMENAPSKEGAVDSQALAQTPGTPFKKWRRILATAIDLLPCAIASLVIFKGEYAIQILIPPLLSPDIEISLPYIAMVVATVAFSMLEEITFGRSMGKRLMGGRVVSIHGEPAAWWQHIARNLLKGLVLLSPVLTIPSLLSPMGAGIPEIISRTKVETTELDPN
ncbi:MAG: RDD family protein [Phycisphaerales bacterium]|nr:RDD family protein [Phycisphaerales bacterium]